MRIEDGIAADAYLSPTKYAIFSTVGRSCVASDVHQKAVCLQTYTIIVCLVWSSRQLGHPDFSRCDLSYFHVRIQISILLENIVGRWPQSRKTSFDLIVEEGERRVEERTEIEAIVIG